MRVLWAMALAAGLLGCDGCDSADCDDSACDGACVRAGHPSGACSSGSCQCIEAADADSDTDTDGDVDSDGDVDGDVDAGGDGDFDGDSEADGELEADGESDVEVDLETDTEVYCGDGACSLDENFRSCETDCAVCDPFDQHGGGCPGGQGCAQIRIRYDESSTPRVHHYECVPAGFYRQGAPCTRLGEALGFTGIDTDPYGSDCAPGYMCHVLCYLYCRDDDDCPFGSGLTCNSWTPPVCDD